MSEDLTYHVAIDATLPDELETPAVAFGQFISKHPGAIVYNDDDASSPLSRFYVDLICGRPLPLQYVTRELRGLSSVVSLALFMDRTLALHPKTQSLVSSVEMASALQESGLAHIDRDLARLFLFLDQYLFSGPLRKKDVEGKLPQVLEWVRNWILEDRLPTLSEEPPPPKVLDRGTNGFVVAETTSTKLTEGVIELYRQGHLRGVLYSQQGETTHVLAFRKSRYLQFDLQKAAGMLNVVAKELGQPQDWEARGLLLKGSCQLPRDKLTEVFLRI